MSVRLIYEIFEQFIKKIINHWLPLLIFLSALFLRLWNFAEIEFKLDEALAIFRASGFWYFKKFPLTGITSSTLAANPPLLYIF